MEAVWGCTARGREIEASAAQGLREGQKKHVALKMRIFISCDSVMKTFNKAFVCIYVRTMHSTWPIPSDRICPCTTTTPDVLSFSCVHPFLSPSDLHHCIQQFKFLGNTKLEHERLPSRHHTNIYINNPLSENIGTKSEHFA